MYNEKYLLKSKLNTRIMYALLIIVIYNNNIYNTQMVAVALGPWASHSEDRAEP